ncbi:hypothetical protein OK344_09255 [Kaistella sp. BT6-1-3]|uniref:Uncharacterized protein n=1 Tax=Kaistella yananensis TaxID=2989820 RepID=A0ABT3JNN4_9FLAO|nr:hypothetical protein [Kaistella yananensis]MCW4452395.1 hypothetical protein [Kaistella yananensis]
MHEKIPPQKTGAKSDTISEIELDSVALAKDHFDKVKRRFLDVNCWELFAGTEKAEFSLRDGKGKLSLDHPKVGDYFRIKVPGLHNPTGDGYDWVQVEKFEKEQDENSECLYIRVRPTSDPTKPEDTTAHFFDSKATSNFLIKREGKKIIAEVHGRNEIPNTENLNVIEKIRNSLVAVGGMIAGSKFQWKSLTEGLIKHEE